MNWLEIVRESELHRLSMEDVQRRWSELDGDGENLDAVRGLCLLDRYYLLVKVMGRVDMLHPWVYERCREVEADPDDHLDLWARDHYKSSVITQGGSIQEVLRNPEITIGIFSHTKAIARSFVAQIKRELTDNEILKAVFPDILYSTPDQESPCWSIENGLIVKRKSNPKEATIEGWGLVDGQPTSRHYMLRIYDDVVVKESVNTPEQIEKTTQALQLSDNLGTRGGRKQFVGTRYSFADTYEWMLQNGSVKPRLYPATDDGTMDGKPVLFTQKQWEQKIRDQGEAVVACQHLQNPLAGTQQLFNTNDFQIYEVRPETLNLYLMVDPARSRKKDSANTAMAVVGVDYALNKYLLDGFAHKMNLQERWLHMKVLFQKWNTAPGVQSIKVGYEEYGAQADFDYFDERIHAEKVNMFIERLAWPNEGPGSKIDRVQRLGPDLRNHRIYLPYPTNESSLTSKQRQFIESGHGYRVAKRIFAKDENGKRYDFVSLLMEQFKYFPYAGLKDIPDAFSRIYDLKPNAPVVYEEGALEPEVV